MRKLTENEKSVLLLLGKAACLPLDWDGLLVEDLDDGGMGSFRIGSHENRMFGAVAAECHFTDSDGVLVLMALNLDEAGQPFELDSWKVDFSKLVAFPAGGAVHLGRPNQSFQRTPAAPLKS